jgi:hypothetical protein
MGLLRKAAATAGLVQTGSAESASASPDGGRPKGPGLFKRSIKALQTETQAPEPAPASGEPAQAVPASVTSDRQTTSMPLAIELAGRQPEPDILPFRIETPEQPAEPAPPATPASDSTAKDVDDLLEQVLSGIASLRGGVELPSRLFTLLTTLLGVRKGALLLYDPMRLVYAPWAVRGYDQTTLHRMRIPLGANDAWNALANGHPLFLEGTPAVSPFQQYFSAREFASVGRLVLVPFITEEKLIAVLLLTEIESPFANDAALSTCLARAAAAGAPRVHEARAAQLASGTSGARPDPKTLKDEPGQLISSLGTTSKAVLLLSLSLEEFARSVLAAHEHLDPFRLHEDLLYFLGSFISDVGRILSVQKDLFTVALPDFDPAGLDLFTHQLALFLHGLFGDNGTSEKRVLPRILKSSSWPADGADLRSLVDSLSR